MTSATAGLFARSEWEQVIEDDNPVIDHSTPLHNQFVDEIEGLAPLFEVLVEHRKWNFGEGGSEIEVVLDEGFVTPADRQVPICEIELELKSGGSPGSSSLRVGSMPSFLSSLRFYPNPSAATDCSKRRKPPSKRSLSHSIDAPASQASSRRSPSPVSVISD
jgi:hypothetical protein